jgi:hypothetical protein
VTVPKPKIFLSWSKPRSKAVAEALYEWLPTVVQNVETWMSAADIDKGSKWRQVLTGELSNANFGILCLTPENLREPWLLFEAGALSKMADSRVWTYLFDLEFTDVKDPLSEFQHTFATKEDTRRLVHSIGGIVPDTLPATRLDRAFDALWPQLESTLAAIEGNSPEEHGSKSDLEEMLKEVLIRVRELERNSRTSSSSPAFPSTFSQTPETPGQTQGSDLQRQIKQCDRQIASNLESLALTAQPPSGKPKTESHHLLMTARERLKRATAKVKAGELDRAEQFLHEAVGLREEAWGRKGRRLTPTSA